MLVDRLQVAGRGAASPKRACSGRIRQPCRAGSQRQPAWSDLPFVDPDRRSARPRVIGLGRATGSALRNVSLLERPMQTITLTSTVRAAVRARPAPV